MLFVLIQVAAFEMGPEKGQTRELVSVQVTERSECLWPKYAGGLV